MMRATLFSASEKWGLSSTDALTGSYRVLFFFSSSALCVCVCVWVCECVGVCGCVGVCVWVPHFCCVVLFVSGLAAVLFLFYFYFYFFELLWGRSKNKNSVKTR